MNMDIKIRWVKYHESETLEAYGCPRILVDAEIGEATHVVIGTEFLGQLMRAWADSGYKITEPTNIGMSYNTQCPDCGFVAEGFDTEEEAAAWTCEECSPSLPFDELSEG